MKIIGLTGPTGAGKSIVAGAAVQLGITVIDCDGEAKAESCENSKMLQMLEQRFGSGIIKNGLLDRSALAKVAFSSKENTAALNEITLPFIVKRIERLLDGKEIVLLDAPTLFESGLNENCDVIISVIAPINLRRERIIKRDGLTAAAANARLLAAKSDSFFKERSDWFLVNDKDEQSIRDEAIALLCRIKEEI